MPSFSGVLAYFSGEACPCAALSAVPRLKPSYAVQSQVHRQRWLALATRNLPADV